MSINEHNYEYFFLMYVDDELNAAERQTVDAFVVAHPALHAELELLKETVLPAGEMKIEKKGLYKTETIEATPDNDLMLYLDGELDAADQQLFKNKLEADTKLQADLAAWQKAKLDADEMVLFPGKAVLYRHEKGRLVTMRIFKWAVAAALIGAGFYAGINLLNRQVMPAEQVAVKQNNKILPGTNNGLNNSEPLNTDVATLQNEPQQTKATPSAAIKNTQPATISLAVKQVNLQTKNNKESIAAIEPATTANQKLKQALQQETNTLQPINSTAKLIDVNPGTNTVLAANITEPEKPSYAKLIANNIDDKQVYTRNALLNDGNEDNHIFLMEEETIARSKAGVFFKKLKRTVVRTANIKSGNSLKIAGFELAVK